MNKYTHTLDTDTDDVCDECMFTIVASFCTKGHNEREDIVEELTRTKRQHGTYKNKKLIPGKKSTQNPKSNYVLSLFYCW